MRQVDLGEAVAVGRHRAQARLLGRAAGMQIDAVQVIARLLGRDRELGPVDQALDVLGGNPEGMRHVARGEIREIAFRQCLQGELGAAGADREHGALTVALQHDLRTIRQLAHNVVEHVRGHGGRTGGSGLGRQRFRHFEVEIGRAQREPRILGTHQHIAQDRDGVAPLDHPVDVAQRLQELRAFDGYLHCTTRPFPTELVLECRRAEQRRGRWHLAPERRLVSVQEREGEA